MADYDTVLNALITWSNDAPLPQAENPFGCGSCVFNHPEFLVYCPSLDPDLLALAPVKDAYQSDWPTFDAAWRAFMAQAVEPDASEEARYHITGFWNV